MAKWSQALVFALTAAIAQGACVSPPNITADPNATGPYVQCLATKCEDVNASFVQAVAGLPANCQTIVAGVAKNCSVTFTEGLALLVKALGKTIDPKIVAAIGTGVTIAHVCCPECKKTTAKKTTAKKTTAKKTTAGKVTFKTTRSKKDAGKVTKKETTVTTTTTTNNNPKVDAHKVEGSLTMTVPDADKAIKDAKFKQAVIDGIAASSKCPAKYITVKMTKARRLSNNVRSLAVITKTLKVAYTMTIPAKNPTKTAQDKVLADMKAIKVADLTKSIQTKVTAAKGKDYKITVSAKSAVTSTKIKIDAPTTAAPVTSNAMNGGAQSILIVVSTLAKTLLF